MSDRLPASRNSSVYDLPPDKVPMHPEDFAALLAWVRAKEKTGDVV
jgi:hypothetical protein